MSIFERLLWIMLAGVILVFVNAGFNIYASLEASAVRSLVFAATVAASAGYYLVFKKCISTNRNNQDDRLG